MSSRPESWVPFMQVAEERVAGDASQMANVLLFGFVLFLLCVFGILTRPGADLASFWPANAFMFGMLVRFPALRTPLSWIACAAGFALADLLTGGTVLKTVVLNLGNLAAITVGYLVFSRFDRADQRLSRPASVLFMLVAIISASLTAGLIGTVADPVLFGGKPLDALLYWSATELVNYVAFLPMILTFPDDATRRLRRIVETPPKMIRLLPLMALVATALAGAAIGGPGAVAFPILALLWCAVTYSLFVTSCLAFAFVSWTLLAISTGYLPVADNFTDRGTLLSIRFAVSLMGLAPIVVASVMAAREELMQRLLFLSSHDQMTGLLNRAAFLADTSNRLGGKAAKNVAVLMLDIDHFKSINDQYGHAAGDRVLIAFAEILKNNIRKGDAAGRLGGEEFAVFLDGCSSREAQEVASRINAVFAATPVSLDDGRAVKATVSVGLAMSALPSEISRLLAQADKALYEAKRQGRNLVKVKTFEQSAGSH